MNYRFLNTDSSATSQRYVAVPNHMLNTESTACIYGVWVLDNERVEWILNSANKVIGYNLKYIPGLPVKAEWYRGELRPDGTWTNHARIW